MMLPEKAKILLASGEGDILHRVNAILVSLDYHVFQCNDGEEASRKIIETLPNLIILDSILPKTDGLSLIRQLKADEATCSIPIIMITAQVALEDRLKALEAGIDDFLNKPFDRADLQARVNSLLKVNAYNIKTIDYKKDVEIEVVKRTQDLTKAFEKIKIASLDTVYRLSRAAEYKDEDTGAHVERMSHYSSAIARSLKLGDEFIENILWAAPMHDIGKIGIPDRVLQKPGKLDADEWVIMKQHTTIGAEILKDSSAQFIKLAAEIAVTHHEKWDGSGYPKGTKGENIPLAGRIVALADVFDALTSERPYKKPFPLEKALSIIMEGKGQHFDPDVVDAFVAIQQEIVAELNWWKFMSTPETSSEPADLTNLFG